MKKTTLFFIFMGLFLLLGCTNTNSNRERNPREELHFFHNVQNDVEEDARPERAKVYYYGEHYFRD